MKGKVTKLKKGTHSGKSAKDGGKGKWNLKALRWFPPYFGFATCSDYPTTQVQANQN